MELSNFFADCNGLPLGLHLLLNPRVDRVEDLLAVGFHHHEVAVAEDAFVFQIGSPFVSTNPANIPGWTHSGSAGDGLLWAVGYADGSGSVTTAGSGDQVVTLGGGFDAPGTADWSTTITGLIPGNSYVLSFMTATELGTGIEPGGPQKMTVGFLSGSSTPTESFTSLDSPAAYWRLWVTQDYTFVASSGSAVVDFSVTNQQYDMGLDDVSISAATATVPEPSTVLLVGPFLLGLATRHSS